MFDNIDTENNLYLFLKYEYVYYLRMRIYYWCVINPYDVYVRFIPSEQFIYSYGGRAFSR